MFGLPKVRKTWSDKTYTADIEVFFDKEFKLSDIRRLVKDARTLFTPEDWKVAVNSNCLPKLLKLKDKELAELIAKFYLLNVYSIVNTLRQKIILTSKRLKIQIRLVKAGGGTSYEKGEDMYNHQFRPQFNHMIWILAKYYKGNLKKLLNHIDFAYENTNHQYSNAILKQLTKSNLYGFLIHELSHAYQYDYSIAEFERLTEKITDSVAFILNSIRMEGFAEFSRISENLSLPNDYLPIDITLVPFLKSQITDVIRRRNSLKDVMKTLYFEWGPLHSCGAGMFNLIFLWHILKNLKDTEDVNIYRFFKLKIQNNIPPITAYQSYKSFFIQKHNLLRSTGSLISQLEEIKINSLGKSINNKEIVLAQITFLPFSKNQFFTFRSTLRSASIWKFIELYNKACEYFKLNKEYFMFTEADIVDLAKRYSLAA